LATELGRQGHRVSHQTVAAVLHALDYRLQGHRKTQEGAAHPDRDAQFASINAQVRSFQQRGQPAIAVDTTKLVGGDGAAGLPPGDGGAAYGRRGR
jgi:hypothetical protein